MILAIAKRPAKMLGSTYLVTQWVRKASHQVRLSSSGYLSMHRGLLTCLLLSLSSAAAFSQTTIMTCVASANPPLVRAEGLAERTGDVVYSCSGGPANSTLTGNLVLFLSVNITNRLLPDGTADVVLTVNGAPANVPARITGANAVSFNGLSIPVSAQGTAELRLQNVRANASQLLGQNGIVITLYSTFNGSSLLAFTNNQFTVGVPQTGLLAASSGNIVCSQAGSPLPSTINFANLAAGVVYASTRVTEGFGTAFAPKSDFSNQNADTGVRIIVNYGGFPGGARLFVPDAITGSDADKQTSSGDFGVPAAGGTYTPGRHELLLIRVNGADANGAGGTLSMAAPLSGPVAFNSVSELSFSNGAAYAVYEVADSDPAVRESALIPAFLGLAPGGATAATTSSVNLAPVSNIATASATAPIPRFVSTTPPQDCTVLNDCNASYFPRLSVFVNSGTPDLQLNPTTGTGFVIIQNAGSGVLQWTATTSASYLKISPAAGFNNGGFRVDAVFTGLATGVYQTTVTIDAGPLAGTRTIPVTVTVPAGGGQGDATPPKMTSLGNAADPTLTAVVPGSITSIFGSHFTGKLVQVLFDSTAGNVLFSNDTQINVVAPITLAGKTTSQLTIVIDGNASTASTINIASASPAIFPGAVLNSNWTPNSEAAPATVGSVLQIFATGLSANGPITAKIHDRIITTPAYAGPAPGLSGVQQVNAQIPSDLPTMQTWVYVCSGDTCSAPVKIWITHRSF